MRECTLEEVKGWGSVGFELTDIYEMNMDNEGVDGKFIEGTIRELGEAGIIAGVCSGTPFLSVAEEFGNVLVRGYMEINGDPEWRNTTIVCTMQCNAEDGERLGELLNLRFEAENLSWCIFEDE